MSMSGCRASAGAARERKTECQLRGLASRDSQPSRLGDLEKREYAARSSALAAASDNCHAGRMDSPRVADTSPGRTPVIRILLASCLGLGYSPVMPGTCGALLGPLLYIPLALAVRQEPWQTLLIGGLLAASTWITIALGRWSESYYGVKDSQIFVTDEVVGFLCTVLLFHLPERPVLTALWAFPITRIIDILKIPPAKRLEKLPAGWGVVADDLLGSLYAATILYALWAVAPHWFGR